MPTTQQQALIDAVRRLTENDARIEAAWLSGSLGRGRGDQWSDVDVLVLVRDADPALVGTTYAKEAEAIAPLALVTPLYDGQIVNFVTQDWQRFDLHFIGKDELGRFDAGTLSVLFNKGTHEPPRLSRPDPYRPSANQLLRLVREFLRVLGLAAVVVGREEYVVALGGVGKLRDMLIELMLMENGVGRQERGGALHLNSLLASEQRMALQALPALVATRESIIAGHEALARLFLPRARRLAKDTGVEWPEVLESTTRRHLLTSLDVRI